MTQFPTLIDQIAAAVLAPTEVTENPHHRAVLDVFVEIQELDRQLAELAAADLPGVSAGEQLDTLTDLLFERMAAGAELSALLSTSCCCAAAFEPDPPGEYDPAEDDEPAFDPDFEDFEGLEGMDEFDDLHEEAVEDFLSCPSRPQTIVHACLDVFDAHGSPEYVSSAELVERLRELPGNADARWRYSDLNALRLSLILRRSHGVQSHRPRAADDSRYRAFRRADLLGALAE
ncbi:DUF3631 domain-containing protein [Streptomyces sp. NBC_00059]|uniref:DUF3631 domain-containing protein n=1 Tax=Streptomyces sp. NBC_00059 TaxID=2975635 RepID=UPI0022543901|nr:DUF3631 domain-containing protein [Streptomyces sp. NBC_00059]MCX5417712.1 DUF3631 domain-containing protein [Streptomyces sp. NBC_00059]